MSRSTVITCAVTGSARLNPRYPAALEFPVTPAQICKSSLEAARAGAAVVHIHVRDPQTGEGSRDPALFREVVDRIRQTGSDVIINLTCGLGALFLPDPVDESRAAIGSDVATVADRLRHIEDCLPDIASLNVTTANQVDGDQDYVYLNTPRTLRAMALRFRQLGVKAELETFQAGDVLLARQLISENLFEEPPLFQFVLGIKWGAPATPETVVYMRDLLPQGAQWTAFGIARDQCRMVAQSVLLGGNVRVGLEDNLYLSRGVFATNAQLVERALRQVEDLGETVATPTQARAILGLRPHP
jgi:uncharacterized protein (DUF849 family)